MTERKVFAMDSRGYALTSDSRDIGVPTELHMDVVTWLKRNDIHTASRSARAMGVDCWRVKDEQERVLFALRWGNAISY